MVKSVYNKKDILHFFKGVSNYFEAPTEANGKLICKKHGIEHTGKNVYSSVIDNLLYKQTNNEKYFKQAKRRVLRTTANMVQDPETGTWIYWPGRLSWRNMSNSAIDSGACTDCLASFLGLYSDRLSNAEKKEIEITIEKNSDSYLSKGVIEKPHTNQRLWGITGLASAYRLQQKKEWKEAVLEVCEVSIKEIRSDGSIPYVTNYTKNKTFKGIVDTTPYYHSRHIAFLIHSFECVGELTKENIERIKPSVDFLVGMYQEDGVKSIALETKRWYFLSEYEVASHSYDVYTLLKYYSFTGDKKYALYAKRALDTLLKHQTRKDGGINDHIGGVRNFQCPFFWNSHIAWLARVYDEILTLKEDDIIMQESVMIQYFKDADIVKVVTPFYACLLRGKKQPQNPQWGPRIGGGSFVYFGRSNNKYKNILENNEWQLSSSGNFFMKKKAEGIFSYIQKHLGDYRSLVFHIKVELLYRDFSTTWKRLTLLARKIVINNNNVGSEYDCITKTYFDIKNKKIQYNSGLAHRDGVRLDGIELKRTYCFEKKKIRIIEYMLIKESVGRMQYRPLINNGEIDIVSDIAWKQKGGIFSFNKDTGSIRISYIVDGKK